MKTTPRTTRHTVTSARLLLREVGATTPGGTRYVMANEGLFGAHLSRCHRLTEEQITALRSTGCVVSPVDEQTATQYVTFT